MTNKITIWHLRDITSEQDFYVPDHEDFSYWHESAIINETNSDFEVCIEGSYGPLKNLDLGDAIQIYDPDTNYYWPSIVVGKLDYYDPVIDKKSNSPELVSPVELTFLPRHDQTTRPFNEEIRELDGWINANDVEN